MNRIQFYYLSENQQQGPVSVEELNSMAAGGRLRGSDWVWQVGTPAWVPAEKVAELVVPPPPPAMALPVATPTRRRPGGESKRIRGLDFVRGSVTNLRASVELWADRDAAGTNQVLTFTIGSQPVEVNMSQVPQIKEGDDVAVAGHLKQGRLQARAYKNWSNGTYDSWGLPGGLAGSYGLSCGLPLTIIGVIAPPALLFGLPMFLTGLYCVLSAARKNRRARRLVNDQDQE
jgi:hypothetical protein